MELTPSAALSSDPFAGAAAHPEQFAAPTLDTVAAAAAQPGWSAALTSGSAARTAAYPEQSAALASNPAAETAAQSEQSVKPASDPAAEAAAHPAAPAPDTTDVHAAQPAADGERNNRTQRRLDWATCSDRPSLVGHGPAVQGGAAAARNAAGQGVVAGKRGTAVQGDTAAAQGMATKGAAAVQQDTCAQSTVAGALQVAPGAGPQAPASRLQQSYRSAEVCGVAESRQPHACKLTCLVIAASHDVPGAADKDASVSCARGDLGSCNLGLAPLHGHSVRVQHMQVRVAGRDGAPCSRQCSGAQ